MHADRSLYYFDLDEYDLKYAGLDPQNILAFKTWGKVLWCLPHEQIL
jgi:hypothetical protein